MERAGLALPNMDHVKKKEKDFVNAKNFDFTEEHIDHVSLHGEETGGALYRSWRGTGTHA